MSDDKKPTTPTTSLVAAKFAGFKAVIEKIQPSFVDILGGVGNARKLAAAFEIEAAKKPELATCTGSSIYASMAFCAQTALTPGTGQVWLIKYGDELHAQPGYAGWIAVARRSPLFQSIEADLVFEPPDFFEYAKGDNAYIKHIPGKGPRMVLANLTHSYCVTKYTNGGVERAVLDRERIEYHRAHSKAKDSSKSPWNTLVTLASGLIVPHYLEMAKVCAFREASKTWPKNDQIEALIQMDRDNTVLESEGMRAPFVDNRDITELTAQLSQKGMSEDELKGELG